MLVSFVVRLNASALAAGRLVGEVEHVASGERGEFRDAAELSAWCARASLPAPRSSDPAAVPPDPAATPNARKSSS